MKVIISITSSLFIVLLFATIKPNDANILCPVCEIASYDNITSDIAQHMDDCTMQESEQCRGELVASYTNEGQEIRSTSFGDSTSPHSLDDVYDFMYETFMMLLSKFSIRRSISTHCSDSSNCSFRHVQLFYKKSKLSSFDRSLQVLYDHLHKVCFSGHILQ